MSCYQNSAVSTIEPRCLFCVPALLEFLYFPKCCVAAAVEWENRLPPICANCTCAHKQENCEPLPFNCFAVCLTPRPRNIEGTDSAQQFQKIRSRNGNHLKVGRAKVTLKYCPSGLPCPKILQSHGPLVV